jgi:hypothetical protein
MFGVILRTAAVFVVVATLTLLAAAVFQFGNFDIMAWEAKDRQVLLVFPLMATVL